MKTTINPIALRTAKIYNFGLSECNRVKAGPGFDTRSGNILSFLSFRFFKKGSCQLLAKVCARSTG